MIPQDIPTIYDGCGKRFSIEHVLSCPKDGLVLARHNDAAKEWGSLRARALVPSAITYEPKSTVGKYRRRELGQEHDRRVEQPMAVHTL